MGAMMTDHGPDIGDAAPQFELPDFYGKPVRIGGPARAGGGPAHAGGGPAGAGGVLAGAEGSQTLLMFTAPTCPVCDKLFPTFLHRKSSGLSKITVRNL